ncbi:MAG: Asp-tRNA(Asn)/Glu-tRNA(Gln) amidotransferase subunit GatC [Clostridia bacterium]|nr:Asp-tRNA(Asn)/Glu-tRNA(Gln) amidotransferase subunit GatC [Clostridia bacterium]
MKITEETVEYVAGLARLLLSADEKKMMSDQMGDILEYMDKLNSLDTRDILPMEHLERASNVFREDSVVKSFDRDKILANAPDKEEGAFKVPRIVD